MDDEIKAALAVLEQALEDERRGATAELAVLACAVESLVRTHPAPSSFAREFRATWQAVGAPNQALEADDEAGDRMRQLLAVLEAACAVPLGVRPPDVAQGSDH